MMFGTKFYKNRWRPSNFRRIWFFYFFLSWHQILKIRCIHEDFSVRKPKSSNGLPWKRTLWNMGSNMGIPIHMLFFRFLKNVCHFVIFAHIKNRVICAIVIDILNLKLFDYFVSDDPSPRFHQQLRLTYFLRTCLTNIFVYKKGLK